MTVTPKGVTKLGLQDHSFFLHLQRLKIVRNKALRCIRTFIMVSFDKKDVFRLARAKMLEHDLMRRDITDAAVLKVMGQIEREEFIAASYASQAYADHPVPIGMAQTISQPYIVALMTQHLQLNKDCTVLEIGTGSGYQTAILAKLCKKVYTVEVYSELSEMAQAALSSQGIDNVEFFTGDGSKGWPISKDNPAPQFDRIIITAAAPKIPAPIFAQLKDNGIVVAPIGGVTFQELIACEKVGEEIYEKSICPCRFVKLTGRYGFSE
jgi:protein-L-isoaspartate(D-aspartate) O-methyltransferase